MTTIIIDEKQLEEIILTGIEALKLFNIGALGGTVNAEVKCYRKGKKLCAKIIIK